MGEVVQFYEEDDLEIGITWVKWFNFMKKMTLNWRCCRLYQCSLRGGFRNNKEKKGVGYKSYSRDDHKKCSKFDFQGNYDKPGAF